MSCLKIKSVALFLKILIILPLSRPLGNLIEIAAQKNYYWQLLLFITFNTADL